MRNRIPNKLGSAVLILAPLVAMQPAQAQSFYVMYEFTGPDSVLTSLRRNRNACATG
jgi:hypothetical protein